MLPPQFQGDVLQETVRRSFSVLFPTYLEPAEGPQPGRQYMKLRVLSFCLASVVYHFDWLNHTIPREHPLRSSALFTDRQLLASLRALVDCRDSLGQMKPSGVPQVIVNLQAVESTKIVLTELASHVRITNREVAEQSHRIVAEVGKKVEEMGLKIMKDLDSRQLESHLTPTGMRDAATEVFGELLQKHSLHHLGDKLDSLVNMLQSRAPSEGRVQEAVVHPQVEARQEMRMYTWGGRIRLLPSDFVLPTLKHSPAKMWNLFIAGNDSTGIPPLKKVAATNCPKPCYKLYCEFLQLMNLIRDEVVRQGAWVEDCTSQAAAAMFEAGKSVLDLPNKGPSGNNVRPDDRAWLTVWRLVSKKKKNPQRARQPRHRRQSSDIGSEFDSESDADEEIEVDDVDDIDEEEAVDARPARKRTRRGQEDDGID